MRSFVSIQGLVSVVSRLGAPWSAPRRRVLAFVGIAVVASTTLGASAARPSSADAKPPLVATLRTASSADADGAGATAVHAIGPVTAGVSEPPAAITAAEPLTLVLLACGLISLAAVLRRQKRLRDTHTLARGPART